ncbi:hypothetical protein EVAR_22471_1 [Eumeta japonica]|uniref:Uncharacterized protein n=1 Tax=Eumeta variegata TaxID=151549 RepID=A0A4C1VCJ0_EUMVA|nr:hypothetical protein EVAR_22471_1 [Eumeta japonica]
MYESERQCVSSGGAVDPGGNRGRAVTPVRVRRALALTHFTLAGTPLRASPLALFITRSGYDSTYRMLLFNRPTGDKTTGATSVRRSVNRSLVAAVPIGQLVDSP